MLVYTENGPVVACCAVGLAATLAWWGWEYHRANRTAKQTAPGVLVKAMETVEACHWAPSLERRVILDAGLSWVTAARFSPDGRFLAAAGRSGIAAVWDMAAPEDPALVATMCPPSRRLGKAIRAVGFHPSGRLMATGGHATVLWSLEEPTHPVPVATLPVPHGLRRSTHAVDFCPTGRLLATGHHGTVTVWNIDDPTCPVPTAALRTHPRSDRGPVNAVGFSPDGRLLVTAGRLAIIIWDVVDPALPVQLAESSTFPESYSTRSAVFSLAFSPDGRLLATADYSMASTQWGASNSSEIVLWDLTDPGRPSPMAALVRRDANRAMYPRPSQLTSATFTGHTETARAVAFSPTGDHLATGGDDRTALLWSVANPAHPRVVGGLPHGGRAYAVAFSPDGRHVVTGGAGAPVTLWTLGGSDRDNDAEVGRIH